MIRMPPLLPFPLLFTASRTLKAPLPIGVPIYGLIKSCWFNSASSFFNEGNFLIDRFASFSKLCVRRTLYFIQKIRKSSRFFISLLNQSDFFQRILQSRYDLKLI